MIQSNHVNIVINGELKTDRYQILEMYEHNLCTYTIPQKLLMLLEFHLVKV